jgi:3-oxoacyl-ACP reductase-like protein
MSIFSSIKNAIFGHAAAAQTPAVTADATAAAPDATAAATTEQPVDVGAVLSQISADKGNPDLNYQTSSVDLMKLLGIDSSLSNREALATELGYTGEKNGSAEMNLWLHRATMQQLADNGGRVPANMLA